MRNLGIGEKKKIPKQKLYLDMNLQNYPTSLGYKEPHNVEVYLLAGFSQLSGLVSLVVLFYLDLPRDLSINKPKHCSHTLPQNYHARNTHYGQWWVWLWWLRKIIQRACVIMVFYCFFNVCKAATMVYILLKTKSWSSAALSGCIVGTKAEHWQQDTFSFCKQHFLKAI